MRYEITVGNVGTVYRSEDKREAVALFGDYRRRSQGGVGSFAGEPVTLWCDGEPIREYAGTVQS